MIIRSDAERKRPKHERERNRCASKSQELKMNGRKCSHYTHLSPFTMKYIVFGRPLPLRFCTRNLVKLICYRCYCCCSIEPPMSTLFELLLLLLLMMPLTLWTLSILFIFHLVSLFNGDYVFSGDLRFRWHCLLSSVHC